MHSGDACPRCLGARAVPCPECGGLFGRRALFSHSRSPRETAGVASSVDPWGLAREEGRGRGRKRAIVGRRRKSGGGGGGDLGGVGVGGLFAAFVGGRASRGGDASADDEEEEDDTRRWLGFSGLGYGAETTLAD